MTPATAASLREACESLGLTLRQLWVDYVGLGGNLPASTIEASFRNEYDLTPHDFDMVVQALNEHFSDRDLDHPLPYADELPPASGDRRSAT